MEKILNVNTDESKSELELKVAAEKSGAEIVAKKGVVPEFIASDKEQKFVESVDSEGRSFRTAHVNKTRTVDFYGDRRIVNLVTDDKAPLVSLVNVSFNPNKNDVTASIKFEINPLSVAAIYYSTAPITLTLGIPEPTVRPWDAKVVKQDDLFKKHSLDLRGLKANTVYNYVIVTKDAVGNENVTLNDTFRTQGLLMA